MRTVLAVCGAVGAALLLAGCSGSTASPPDGAATLASSPDAVASTPMPQPSPSPTTDTTEAEVLAVYAAFWAAQARSMEDPTRAPDPRLDETAQGSALNDALTTLVANRRDGLAMTGAPRPSPRVRQLDLVGGTAELIDCLDISDWHTVSAKTGKPVKSHSAQTELVVTSTVVRSNDSWKLDRVSFQRGQSC